MRENIKHKEKLVAMTVVNEAKNTVDGGTVISNSLGIPSIPFVKEVNKT